MNQSNPGARAGVVSILAVLLIALIGSAAEAGNLDRYLEKQMRKARVPGLATAIVVDDEVVQLGGYGWANPDDGTAVTPDTLFFTASMSKSVTATTAMRLVQRRRLDLDADVNDYLPFEIRNPYHPDAAITLRQLMSHTSSINDDGFYLHVDEISVDGDWPGTFNQYLIDYLTPGGRYYAVATSFHPWAPGEQGRYSNVGVSVVGAVVEAVTGESFEDVSQKEVLRPLGMTESSWLLANLDLDHIAVPCGWDGAGFFVYPHQGLAGYSAGSLKTSAAQWARFMRLHLNGGRFEGRRLLKRRIAAEMVKVQYAAGDDALSLGFWLELDGELRMAHHRGGGRGSAAWMWLGLDEGIGIVLLTNGEPTFTDQPAAAFKAFVRIKDRLYKEGRRIAARGSR